MSGIKLTDASTWVTKKFKDREAFDSWLSDPDGVDASKCEHAAKKPKLSPQ
jgi:hypothetical protein